MDTHILHVDLDRGPAREASFPAPPDLARRAVGQHLHAILGDFSSRIEPLSLDQCWLDVRDNRVGLPSAAAVARRIRERVRDELGLKCAIGVAPLRYVAKLAADERRPDGLNVVQPGDVCAFVHPLPVQRMWGVGPVTSRRLGAHGVVTIGDLAALPEGRAAELLGRNQLHLWRMANGHDPREVRPGRRSRGQERTFPVDVGDVGALRREVERQARDVCRDLHRAGESARTVTVKVRYATFETVTRSRTREPTRDPDRIVEVAAALLVERTDVGRRPVRLVGIQLSGLAPAVPQLALPLSWRDRAS